MVGGGALDRRGGFAVVGSAVDRRRVCLHCGFAVVAMDFRCGSGSLRWW